MPVPIDPDTLYTIADVREMFDVSEQWIRDAMSSPVQRLEAARIGATVYIRGDHLLKYLASLIPDSPTALADEIAPRTSSGERRGGEPASPGSLGLLRTGQFEIPDAPKVLSGQVKQGRLVRPPSGPVPTVPADPDATMRLTDAAAIAAAHLAGRTPPRTPPPASAAAPPAPPSPPPASPAAAGHGAGPSTPPATPRQPAAPVPSAPSATDSTGRGGRPGTYYNVDELLREAEQITRERERVDADKDGGEAPARPSRSKGDQPTVDDELDKWL